PIQIAEILYKIRTEGNIDPLNLEDYRTKSKRWRDDVCLPLLGRVCTSSARFQDDLFNDNAVPPQMLNVLNNEN
ncbi:HaeII family restriction endonuclease, partial [Agathobaculum butyriciproducens]|nr:HaeII family restriction endonuclease [Agathobaculum butyriciproducens]